MDAGKEGKIVYPLGDIKRILQGTGIFPRSWERRLCPGVPVLHADILKNI
jgi:hypothetical protein